jgi:O-antigen/teichoic acid export membrane protein
VLLSAVAGAAVGTLLASPAGSVLVNAIFDDPVLAGTVVWVGAWVALEAVRVVVAEAFRGFSDIRSAVLYSQASRPTAAMCGFIALAIVSGHSNLRVVLYVAVGSSAITVVVAIAHLARRLDLLSRSTSSVGLRPLLATSIPLMVAQLIFTVIRQGDLWVIGAFRGPDSVALYGAALQLATFAGVPLLVMNLVLAPLIAEMNITGRKEQLEEMLRASASATGWPMLGLLIIMTVLGGPILSLIFGDFYASGLFMFVCLGGGQVFSVLMGANGLALAMTGHHRYVMLAALAAGGSTLVGELLVVGPLGANAVAVVSGTGTVLNNILLVLLTKRRLGIWTCASLSPRRLRRLGHDLRRA